MRPVISRRINKIKDLAKGYYLLNKGDLIEKHDELLRIHTIKDSKNDKHPQITESISHADQSNTSLKKEKSS